VNVPFEGFGDITTPYFVNTSILVKIVKTATSDETFPQVPEISQL
jgi:hypothetical protein